MRSENSYKAQKLVVPHLDCITEKEGDEDGKTSFAVTSETGRISAIKSEGFSIFVSENGYKASIRMKDSANVRKPMSSYLEGSINIKSSVKRSYIQGSMHEQKSFLKSSIHIRG